MNIKVWLAGHFNHERWHRMPYQPILFLFVWVAVFRVIFENKIPPSVEELGHWFYHLWAAMTIIAPIELFIAWWLIAKSHWHKATLVGNWLRLGADMTMFLSLLAFHVQNRLCGPCNEYENDIVHRYIMGSVLVFMLLCIVRDFVPLIQIERIAPIIRERQSNVSDE